MCNTLLSIAVLFLLLASVSEVWAQGAPNGVVASSDTFPAGLGYAALGAVSAAGAVMSGVITKLWYGLRDQAKEHQIAVDQLRADNHKMLEICRNDCRKEIDDLRKRLEQEQTDRRQEAERLLREQKDIMKEVMVTCTAVATALQENTKALERLVGGV